MFILLRKFQIKEPIKMNAKILIVGIVVACVVVAWFVVLPMIKLGPEEYSEVEGIINPDNITQITSFEGKGCSACDSDWSSDGTQIAFGRDTEDEKGLYVINSDGTGLFKIGPSDCYGIYDPSWSPVDNRILCTGWEEGESSGLFIIDLDEDKAKIISLGAEYVMFPAWSPDGKKIVYMVYNDSNAPLPLYDPQCDGTGVLASIWIMNSNGTGKTQLTTDEDGYCSDPSFSPDGSKIVYNKGFINPAAPFLTKEPPNEIWVMNSNGSDKHMIHTTGDCKYFLHQRAWSKNNEIIFEKLQWQKSPEVWIMNANGTNPRCLIRPIKGPDGELLTYHDIAWDTTGTKIITSRHKSAVYEGEMPDVSSGAWSHLIDTNLVTFPWKG